ncbi:MAG: molybdopterin molybdotransferase MoeA [Actinomycetota bacterium]|nr:molybdopterin molybdotransferase MoeA [Actinomycetota bacterium]
MISLYEAQEFVLSKVERKRAIATPLDKALGLVTSGDVVSMVNIPPFDNTAVDGFAIDTESLEELARRGSVTLSVEGTIAAGDGKLREIPRGSTYRIMTGARTPEGTAAVVMVEDSIDLDGGAVELRGALSHGSNIRRKGSDVSTGDVVVPEGTVLNASHIGTLASIGLVRVPVYRRLRVGVLSTGDELKDGGESLEEGQIYDSNRHSLVAALSQSGVEVVDLGIIRDDADLIRDALSKAAKEFDAIATSGGVSVGDFDFTKAIVQELSQGNARWMQIAIRPAKPFAFGVLDGAAFFGLPGNPVSALVSFELLMKPALAKMAGKDRQLPKFVKARSVSGYKRSLDGKIHFIRGVVSFEDDEITALPLPKQSSHNLNEMSQSNCLIEVPDSEGFEAGDLVRVLVNSSVWI